MKGLRASLRCIGINTFLHLKKKTLIFQVNGRVTVTHGEAMQSYQYQKTSSSYNEETQHDIGFCIVTEPS